MMESKTVQTGRQATESKNGSDAEYTYQTAGIRERHGYVPVWLILVCVGLLVWGGYYLWTYWTPPLG
ncbi:hypothetical protein ACTRW9_03205 [Nitrospina sp. 32_T5]|uniref:hypothetical protein n=1 Tax=unclassified Nitrospina TaxID=2638683 RepID=UPI003F972BE2